eukprot:5911895-Heterocapsa_arctica.AAC.1
MLTSTPETSNARGARRGERVPGSWKGVPCTGVPKDFKQMDEAGAVELVLTLISDTADHDTLCGE